MDPVFLPINTYSGLDQLVTSKKNEGLMCSLLEFSLIHASKKDDEDI